jgi:two-component system, NtrC family, sensor kinase
MAQKERDPLVEQAKLAALGTMCASVTHEMSNPLSYVLTNLRFLAEELPRMLRGESSGADIDDVTQTLADALEGAERLSSLLGSVRAFARGDVNARGPVDVAATIENAAVLARSEVRRRGQLVVSSDGNPVAWASDVGLMQAVVTLLVHASHVMTDGESQEVRVHSCTEANVVEISILFDTPAPEAMASPSEASELSVCRRLVEAQGGVLRVARQERKTLFFVGIPARAQTHADSLPPRAA